MAEPEANEYRFKIPDIDGKTEGLAGRIVVGQGIEIFIDGYGCKEMEPDGGGLIYIEMYNGMPAVNVWNNIRSDAPVKLPLDLADEDLREPEPLDTQPDHTVTAEYLQANKWVAEPCELQLPVPDTWWKRKVQGGYVAVWKSQQFEDTWQFVVSCGPNSERSMSGCNASMIGAMEEAVERAKVLPRN